MVIIEQQRYLLEVYRTALQNKDGHEYRYANNLFTDHIMEWSEDFCGLEQEIAALWRSYTPRKTGMYKVRRGKLVWVDDKVQPVPPTSEEVLIKFDALVETYFKDVLGSLF